MKNEADEFVGEIAYHYDRRRDIYICDVIILAKFRNRGYGTIISAYQHLAETILAVFAMGMAYADQCMQYVANGFIG